MAHHILTHHTQGLHALAVGDYATAATCLRAALHQLQEGQEDIDLLAEGSALVLIQQAPLVLEDAAALMESRAIVYTGAFRVGQVNGTTAAGLVFDKALLATAILYHLGLTFQLRGNCCRERRAVRYRQAVSFYTLAMQAWNEILPSPTATSSFSPLALAIGNNLACLYAETNEYAKVESCVAWLMARASPEGLAACAWLLANIHMWQAAKTLPSASA
jgi:hypothetical protein